MSLEPIVISIVLLFVSSTLSFSFNRLIVL